MAESIAISKRYSFDAAHILWRPDWDDQKNREVFGKCSKLHGHTYTVEVTVERLDHSLLSDTEMVLNYFHLDEYVKPLIESLDHELLNELPLFEGHLTTAENIARVVADYLQKGLSDHAEPVRVIEVVVQETPKTKATWYAY